MMTNVAAQLTETFRQQRLPDDPNVTSTMYFTCFFFQFSVKFNLWNVKDTSLDVGMRHRCKKDIEWAFCVLLGKKQKPNLQIVK